MRPFALSLSLASLSVDYHSVAAIIVGTAISFSLTYLIHIHIKSTLLHVNPTKLASQIDSQPKFHLISHHHSPAPPGRPTWDRFTNRETGCIGHGN